VVNHVGSARSYILLERLSCEAAEWNYVRGMDVREYPRFEKIAKMTASSRLSAHPSACKEQLGSHSTDFNPLKPELNPIYYLLALLAHHFLHVSRIRVKSLTIRLLMSYIYGAPILDVSRKHTTTQHSR